MRLYFEYDIRGITKDNERIRRSSDGKYFLSKKYKQFENDIWLLTKNQLPRGFHIFKHDVAVKLIFYYRMKNHADLTNLPKSTIDAVSGCLFLDDKLIKHADLHLYENCEKDCITLEVTDELPMG